MRDEVFHLFASGVAERLDAAEFRGVGLNQGWDRVDAGGSDGRDGHEPSDCRGLR